MSKFEIKLISCDGMGAYVYIKCNKLEKVGELKVIADGVEIEYDKDSFISIEKILEGKK